jgi:phosphoglycolate phosphatase-like HAD superfamily hydrolase
MLLGRALATDDPAQIEAARRTFAGHYRGALLDTTRLFPGVAEMLRRLAPLPLAVATNKPAAFTAPIAEGLELARHGIRACACADEAGARKPDPRVLRLALERAGAATILPAEVLMVGDMPVDVATARGHGAKAAVVTWGFTARGGLEAARPDVIVDRPEDLAAWVEIENRDDQNPKTWGG